MDFRFLRLRGSARFDAIALLTALLLFVLNEHIVKPCIWSASPDADFTFIELVQVGYFNDFLGGLAFLAYTNLLIDLVRSRYRIQRLFIAISYIAACGLFWEYVAPLFVPNSVSDPWDVLAYCLGGAAYRVLDASRLRANGVGGRCAPSANRRRDACDSVMSSVSSEED